jgi:transcriptional regulator of acetoin/glycerol metabolism
VRRFLLAVMRRHGWNVSAAARELAVNRTDFYKVMRRYGIEPRTRMRPLDRT